MKKKWFVRSCVVAAICFTNKTHSDAIYAQDTTDLPLSVSAAESNSSSAGAADQSVVVLGLAPIDRLLPNVQHLARLIGGGQAAGVVASTVNQFSNGVDRKRPTGVFLDLSEDGTPQPVVCLPISNFDTFSRQLAILGEPEDLGDGLYAYHFGNSFYLRHVDSWLVAGQSEDSVLNFDSATTANLDGLVKNYDLRVQVNPQNVPEELFEQFFGGLVEGIEGSIANQPDMDEEDAELARRNAEQTSQNIRDLINGTEKFVVGLAVSPKSKKTILDLGTKVVSGSKLATQLQQYAGAKSELAAVVQPGAAISSTSVQFISKEDLKQAEDSLEVSLNAIFKELDEKDDERFKSEAFKNLIRKVAGIALDSARQGRVESAINVNLDSKLDVILAAVVQDGKEVDSAIADFADVISKEASDEVKVKVNAGKIGAANLHRLSFKLDADAADEAKAIFGDTVEVAIASGPKAVYIAVGPACESSVKQAVERVASAPTSAASMVTARVKVSKIAAFIEKVAPSPITSALVTATSSGNDSINVDSKVGELESVVRVTVEDQVFKGIQDGIKAAQGDDGF